MKRTIKTMLLFVAGAMILASCAEDPLVPPVGGFTLDNDAVVQWDMATITSTATGATETTYVVTGGSYEMDDATNTIQFLEAATYTITQTTTNADGTTETPQDVVVTAPDNSYTMSFYGDNGLAINGDAYWFESFGTVQIRINGAPVTSQETDNTIKFTPDMGLDPFHGSGTRNYTYSADGGSGTYTGAFTHYPETGTDWDNAWFTTTEGSGVEVKLVYSPEGATDESDYIYDITMSNTTLVGYYNPDFSANEDASGVLTVSYRGKLTPLE